MRTPHLLASTCTTDPESAYRRAEHAIAAELSGLFEARLEPWHSPQEGAMLLTAELDELWTKVKTGHAGLARQQAVLVGALALRLVADLGELTGPARDRARAAAAQERQIRDASAVGRGKFASLHEAFGFLKLAFGTVWAAVESGDTTAFQAAAATMAAQAVRFVAEVPSSAAAVSA
ncbi:Uncharacterised protein [Mycobacteroides abscessus subsp. abscessus]|uniref:hypothetical protein n=1 Tax=Mycobacteroides abscessus TaxID=36809 RepID=UPI0009264EB6|nr:hypothetical protein [Mycobacteroides abscessus]SIJ20889.1 Uncharacterised protein [Mycobacteroides abscessus subsp. abscessus]SLH39471.1 Uncharacterised protein [Mycobacteroides abscessus subsp. abscessus]